jgi:hypothetical protein
VIAQVVVGVGNQHVEHDPPPQLAQIVVHPRAFAPQEFGNLEVAARLVVGGVERSER